MSAKRRSKSKMAPHLQPIVHQMRYEIATKLGYIDLSCGENWWDCLTNQQKSEIQGQVTKLMIAKAQMDMINGNFKH